MAEYKQPVVIPNPDISDRLDPNTVSAKDSGVNAPARRVSGGDPGRNFIKTDGIKIRGTGAATKGVKARGPMA